MDSCNIKFVAHAHFNRYENGKKYPVEVSWVSILKEGVEELNRYIMLLTVDNSKLYRTAKDSNVNRVINKAVTHLPMDFVGDFPLQVVEKRIIQDIGDSLVPVKGEEEKRYFEDIGLQVVNLEKVGHFPNRFEIPIMYCTLPNLHEIHLQNNCFQCSVMKCLKYAMVLEEKLQERLSKQSCCNDPESTKSSSAEKESTTEPEEEYWDVP